jgi:predicted RNA-binding protein (virulence factor B family)
MLAAMPFDDLLGRTVTLPIRRFGPPGAFLARGGGDEDAGSTGSRAPTILLPGAEVPEGAREGDELDVFVSLDSEDRPIATTRAPRIELGEVAFLEVTDVTRIGAFVDWGLPKELLVPFAEQTRDVRVGERHAIGLFLDDSSRLAGTMRVSELLRGAGDFEPGEWVEGEAWRRDPELGVFVIVERRFVGRLPASEPNALRRGEAARFRITNVLEDGKIELSLRGIVSEELERDASRVLEVLSRPGAPRVGDGSPPDTIRAVFGLSKKAFKRAVGRLLREGAVALDHDGVVVRTGSRTGGELAAGARGPHTSKP